MPWKIVMWPTKLECDIRAAPDGKAGCKTVECTTDLLYSDWLYYLRHGINHMDCTKTELFKFLLKRNAYDYTLSETNSISSSVSSLAVMARRVSLRSSLPR